MVTFGWLSQGSDGLEGRWGVGDDTQSLGVSANTNPAPNQTVPPQSFASSGVSERGGRRGLRGVDESLNRTEEGHTGAMAIPKTTYLLSHNDSACQNNCQDT